MKYLQLILSLFFVLSQISCGDTYTDKIGRFVKNWETAQNNHDVKALKKMYAPLVFYFGSNRDSDKVLKSKKKYFKVDSDYEESIQSDIKIVDEGNHLFSCSYLRRVIYKKRITETSFCLVIKHIDNEFKIVEELDAITCKNTNKANFPANAIAPNYMCTDDFPITPTSPNQTKIERQGAKLYLLEKNKKVLLSSKLGPDAIVNSHYIAWWEGESDELYTLKVYSLKDQKSKNILEVQDVVLVYLSGFSADENFLYACYNEAGTLGSIQGCYAVNLKTSKVVGEVSGESVNPNPKDKNSVLVYKDSHCLCGGYERFEYIYDIELKTQGIYTKTFNECDKDCDEYYE